MKQKSTGSKHMASAGATGRSKGQSTNNRRRYPYLAICVYNKGNEASLERGKAYRVIKPRPNDSPLRIRVIDEEGEDYLYLSDWFVPIEITDRRRRRMLEAVVG